MEIVNLSNGILLRCRPVPPHATFWIYEKYPDPPFPMVNVETKGGGKEVVPALKGSAEYEEWKRDRIAARANRNREVIDFNLDYTAVDWKYPGTDEWTEEVPDDWHLPSALIRHGMEEATDPIGRRLQYIKYGLIETDIDDTQVTRVMNGKSLLTKEEVNAALAPFVSSMPEGDRSNQ